ncbi:hypothetical protein ACFL6C_03860 [Myxococcota bacterium]
MKRSRTCWTILLIAAAACQGTVGTDSIVRLTADHRPAVENNDGDRNPTGDARDTPSGDVATGGDSVVQACAIRFVPALTAVWPEPVRLPDTVCDDGVFIRRVKVARGQNDGAFAVFYSTSGIERAIRAQAYALGATGPESLCGGQSFVVIDGGNSKELMDFNVIRRNSATLDSYYLAYTDTPKPPPPTSEHNVHAAHIRFNLEACTLDVIQDRVIKTLDDNECEKGGEPFIVDAGSGLLFAEWWHEVRPDREPDCDLGVGDIGLQFIQLRYDLGDNNEPPFRLLGGEPYVPDSRPLFMDPGFYDPFTRVFHATHRPEGLYICHNASSDGSGVQDYNRTASGTFMNEFCSLYDVDSEQRLRHDPECNSDVVDQTGLDELFIQGVTLLPGKGDDPLLVLYSYDSDGTKVCKDQSSCAGIEDCVEVKCFDELRLTDMAGHHLTVLPSDEAYEWGPSEDGFITHDEILGDVAVVAAMRKDSHCPYLQVIQF